MIACFDLDGTIDADPDYYKAEMRGVMAAGNEAHVVSGNPLVEQKLASLGLVKGRDYTVAVTVPQQHIAAAKVAYMKSVGATHLTDNDKPNIRAARHAGFTGHWHAKPKPKSK